MPLGAAYLNQQAKQGALQAALAANQPAGDGGGIFDSVPNLGVGQLFKELGSGITGLGRLAYSALPGGPKSTLPTAALGFTRSVLGTASTLGKIVGIPGTEINLGDALVEPIGAALLGEENRPQDFLERARERGILPALVEDVGNVALLGGAVKGALTAGAKAAEAAGNIDKFASLSARAQAWDKVAHPYVAAGRKVADLAGAAKLKVAPPIAGAAAVEQTATEAARGLTGVPVDEAQLADMEALDGALKEVADTTKAAAGTLAARTAVKTAYAADPELLAAADRLMASEGAQGAVRAGEAAQARNAERLGAHTAEHGAEPTVTVWRGEDINYPERGSHWTADAKEASAHATDSGYVYKVEVPKSVWEASQEAAREGGHFGANGLSGDLPLEWADVSVPVHGPATDAVRATEKLAKVTPEEAGVLHEAAAAARAALPAPEKLAEIAARIAPPEWAQKAVAQLPDFANKALARIEGPLTKWRLRQVERELSRWTRVAQKVAQSSEAVQEATRIGEQMILTKHPELDRFAVSRMVGEEIGARLDGTDWMATMIRDGGTPEVAAKLQEAARRGFEGIGEELYATFDEGERAALDSALDHAAETWRAERLNARQQMLASSKGAKGLEHAILESDSPLLTRKELKAYNRAKQDLRRSEKLRLRAVDEQIARGAELAKTRARLRFRSEVIDRVRTKLGEASERLADRHLPLPRGLENIAVSVQSILAEIAETGGATFDVGTGLIERPTSGIAVGIGVDDLGTEIFDMPVDQFTPNAESVLADALRGQQDAWYSPKARLGLWTYTDGEGVQRIAADVNYIADHRAEALIVGEAYGQKALYDFATGDDINLSEAPRVQGIAAHYLDDAMRQNSTLRRVWDEMQAANDTLSPSDVDDAMRLWMHMDYSLHRSTGRDIGSFFKELEVQKGVRTPTAEHLAQTVLNLSTDEATTRALRDLSPQAVNDALAWYYDSHDYVEKLWRGKPVTLLNGTTRDAADVFYDLLAVTSVMASPKQNLGRALMGFANMSDFLGSQKTARKAAEALMKRIAEVEPGVVERDVTNSFGQSARQKVSTIFAEIPELEALTSQTSMVYRPMENVLDIMFGKLDLSKATTSDIASLPESWGHRNKGLSHRNVPRHLVADRLRGSLGEGESHPYLEWHDRYDEAVGIADRTDAEAAKAGTSKAKAFKTFDTGFTSYSEFQRHLKSLKAEEITHLDDTATQALDTVTMEYHGSKALAKLRSFRDNLANPNESLAVTLDSVMARLYGIDSTDWSGGNTYGMYADQVRAAAENLGAQLGRTVKPHEVQALLWVYAKLETGRQDWGRLLYHHDDALGSMGQALESGTFNDPSWDPLGAYWEEELGYSREAAPIRAERSRLKQLMARAKEYGDQPPSADVAALAELERLDVASPRTEGAMTALDREDLAALPEDGYRWEDRQHIPFDAKILGAREESFSKWHDGVLVDIRKRLAEGDLDGAQKMLTDYVVSRRRSVQGTSGGSFQIVGEETRIDPLSSANAAEKTLRASKTMPAPSEWVPGDYPKRGDLTELHQGFNEKLRGALVLPTSSTARHLVRLFEGAGLDTLAHEGAHLLRQMLNPAEMEAIEAAFPGISGVRLTAAKRAAEESFVASMMTYLKSNKGVPGLGGIFEKITATLDEVYAPALDSVYGPTTPDVREFWDNTFQPDMVRPDQLTDPLSRSALPRGVETKKFRWESDAQFSQRARQYGEARSDVRHLKDDLAFQEGMRARLQKSEQKMLDVMDTPTKSDRLADRLERVANQRLEQVGAKLENRAPQNPAWQPIHEAWTHLRKLADSDPSIAAMLEEVPDNFAEVIALAVEKGFNPAHIKDIGWGRAQSVLFGHISLGRQGIGTAVESGSRKVRTGVLARQGLADRSIEALASATVEAMHERYTNYMVEFVEKNYARPLEAGQSIPEGWTAWDPERSWVLTGETPSAEALNAVAGAGVQHMIPEAVQRGLRSMGGRYDHWAFHGLTRLTSPWRTFVLTLSPKWYVNNVVGNTMLATVEGVRLRDWVKAYKKSGGIKNLIQHGPHDLPTEVVGQSITSFEGAGQSLVQRGVRDTARAEGRGAALREFHSRLGRLNESVDEIARTAVYESHLRRGATTEHAIRRAYEAMVDYGDLSAVERGLVRSVVPFYAWQKGIFKLLTRMPNDHPLAAVIFQQMGLLHMEMMKDEYGGSIPDAYLGMIGGINTRPYNPFLDAAALTSPEGIAQSMNPFADILIRDAYHAPEGKVTGYEMNDFGRAVPNVDVTGELANVLRGLPQVRLGEQTLKGEDLYGQQPGLSTAITRFAGAPRQYSGAELTSIIERLNRARGTIAMPNPTQLIVNSKTDEQRAARK